MKLPIRFCQTPLRPLLALDRFPALGSPPTPPEATDRLSAEAYGVERQNLTMRMAVRRFTRLTDAFSKKLDNLKAACALHFA
jgi:IS1 family transposase